MSTSERQHTLQIKAEEGEWKDAKVGTAWQEAKRKTKEGIHGWNERGHKVNWCKRMQRTGSMGGR